MPDLTKLQRDIAAKWAEIAARHSDTPRLSGQEQLAPYFITKFQEQRPITLLVTNKEAASWYDRVELTDSVFCRALGLVREGDTVFDCGANQGVTSILFADTVGDRGMVYAFDPFPSNIELIELNAYLNTLSNVRAIAVGLSDTNARVTTAVHEQTILPATDSAPDAVSVAIDRLDDYSDLEPDFLKIDVEGAELNCLRGAARVLSRTPSICLELHPEMIPNFGATIDELPRLVPFDQYRMFIRHVNSSVVAAYAGEPLLSRCWLYFLGRGREPITRLSL